MSLTVYAVSGLIGAGKSTVLRTIGALTTHNDTVSVIEEDVSTWAFYLNKFYADPRKWGFYMQLEVVSHYQRVTKQMHQLAERAAQTGIDHTLFVERSPIETYEVFFKHNQRTFTDDQYNGLALTIIAIGDDPHWRSAKSIWVRASVDTCMARIKTRNRPGEENIEKEYLVGLKRHYDWIETTTPIILFNDADVDGVESIYKSVRAILASFGCN